MPLVVFGKKKKMEKKEVLLKKKMCKIVKKEKNIMYRKIKK